MRKRVLGRTGLLVSEIGLGAEHLYGPPRQVAVDVVREAHRAGVNYIDVVFGIPEFQEDIGVALAPFRHEFVVTGHLNGLHDGAQPRIVYESSECRPAFDALLKRLDTDYVDILNIQVIDTDEQADQILASGGLVDLAEELKAQGKCRFVGVSGHVSAVARRLVETDRFDMLMYPVNFSSDSKEVLDAALSHNVGIVAMKVFRGGEYFQEPYDRFVTPAKAIAFALSQPGVSAVVPGPKSVEELRSALHYVHATEEERDYTTITASFKENIMGTCIYCTHCLPCPQQISISEVMWNLRAFHRGFPPAKELYLALATHASECLSCGQCMERCPYKVDIIGQMRKAVEVFGK